MVKYRFVDNFGLGQCMFLLKFQIAFCRLTSKLEHDVNPLSFPSLQQQFHDSWVRMSFTVRRVEMKNIIGTVRKTLLMKSVKGLH